MPGFDCDANDVPAAAKDALNVYLSGKVALEGAGCDNRFESIWDDYLDDNPETKASSH